LKRKIRHTAKGPSLYLTTQTPGKCHVGSGSRKEDDKKEKKGVYSEGIEDGCYHTGRRNRTRWMLAPNAPVMLGEKRVLGQR
jgi:hypothetical protein